MFSKLPSIQKSDEWHFRKRRKYIGGTGLVNFLLSMQFWNMRSRRGCYGSHTSQLVSQFFAAAAIVKISKNTRHLICCWIQFTSKRKSVFSVNNMKMWVLPVKCEHWKCFNHSLVGCLSRGIEVTWSKITKGSCFDCAL